MWKAISLFIFAVLVSLALATLPNSVQVSSFVNSHNYYRSAVNPPARYMPKVIFNNQVASTANTWAAKCTWAHSGTPGVGENLYATSVRTPYPSYFNPNTSVNAWASEKPYYNYYTNSCTSSHSCGHYTQIIWANSTSIGCAFQDCPYIKGIPWPNGGTIVVCQYYPPGNWWGQRPYVAAL